jgi:two-component system, NtrC family, nitrogen regulation sensor histidine kinase NtrY
MKERVLTAVGAIALAVSLVLVIWQGSFTFGEYAPTSIEQTWMFWLVSTLIFLLMVTLGFMLFRTAYRLYLEAGASSGGTGIKTKMVVGALALTFIPVFFMVLWSVSVLNRNLDKWFSRPAENVQLNLQEISHSLEKATRDKAEAQADWIGDLTQLQDYLTTGVRDDQFFDTLCEKRAIGPVYLLVGESNRLSVCPEPPEASSASQIEVRIPVFAYSGDEAVLVLSSRVPEDLAARQSEINRHIAEYEQLRQGRRATRGTYLLLLSLITLFILFVATWFALFLAKQINVPIAALLMAAAQVRRGNLGYRVDVTAIDELGSLVRAFNEMTESLESNSRELELRRRFIEAVVDNIPSGVASISARGAILMANSALTQIFTVERVQEAERIDDLFPAEEAPELRYLMNRSRRTSVATRQFDFTLDGRPLHLAVTVSSLEGGENQGFVVVIEDTTELLRAQKTVAWREVARRIAHEVKNPLTPISLSAQRIDRQVDKACRGESPPRPEIAAILKECASTISQEVESVRTLVDEFSRFARFPSAKPVPADLNEVVEAALAVFQGRLDKINLKVSLAPDLATVKIDRDQFKRVIVNLVDNSCESMTDSPVKELLVATRLAGADAVELLVADTGSGVSIEEKEKLFLPYFSTKGRGTGLGLAIVNQIIADHGAQIRVEDNIPMGTRFIVDIPTRTVPAEEPVESRA